MATPDDSPTAYLADRPVLSRRQARILGVAAPLLLAAVGAWIGGHVWLDRPEGLTIDWRFRARGPRQPPRNIIIVEIDETSRRSLQRGGRRFNLREHLAPAVDHLAEAGALVVGLDVWLTDLTTPEIDGRLAEVIRNSNVVLAVTHTDGVLKRAASPFRASAPHEGVITVYPDVGNVLRRLPERLYLDVLGPSGDPDDLTTILHFPLALAWFAALEEDPGAKIVLENDSIRIGRFAAYAREWIDVAALPGSAKSAAGSRWRTLRFDDVVRGAFDAAPVDGAIVLLGESRKITDSHVMSLSDELVPGIYYHANALAHILEGRHFNAAWASGLRRRGLTAFLVLAAGLFAWNQREWWRHRRSAWLLIGYLLIGVAVFPGGWATTAFVLFKSGVLLPVTGPILGMGLALASGFACQWVILGENARRLDRRARRIETLFGQSVSDSVLEALRQHPERIQHTQTRDVSVLFCDLRGFTARTEEMAPADVAEMLNEYFNYITDAVFEQDGFIDKFVGDEVMAVFSVPFEQKDHPLRAVRAAMAIKRRLAELNRLRTARGDAPLSCGLGLHCGLAAAGHIGSRQRSNYTVVGTTVNLAARIEQFTSGGEILVSEALRRRLPPEIRLRQWGTREIRGSSGPHTLYEVEMEPSDT
ncbi:MAG: CHASE2 domain-containing protein [Phycisphaerae bacterium]